MTAKDRRRPASAPAQRKDRPKPSAAKERSANANGAAKGIRRETTQQAVGSLPTHASPKVQALVVPEDRDGQRLDNFLTGHLKGVPRSLIYRICRTGEVRVNGGRAKPDHRLVTGDVVRVPPVRVAERGEVEAPAGAQLGRIEAAIIHEDREFLVIDKPAGVASHGGSGVSFGAIELMRAARPRDTLELAHRLDRDTSGVLVLTRKRSALTALQAAIREGRVTKRYVALIMGRLPRSRLTVDAALRKSVLQGGERMVRVDPEGKASRSHFTELEAWDDASLVEVALETGRTHQIRVHAQHIDHPLAGDEKYGDREFNKAMRELGVKRLFLHAAHFEFDLGERRYRFSAPLAPDLAKAVEALRRRGTASGR
jgi:23S rRNA pseudouridine955/2504/2580 synthase